MKLSRRIYALRDTVCKGESIADIGTDHGYVPMLAVRDRISPFAIMSDISEDSLSKAVDTFRLAGLTVDSSFFRVGDGLETIDCGEVDDIIIAGLGGHTIVQILQEDIDKTGSFKKLILQPRKHSGALRLWLYRNGYKISDEILVSEGKFICEIIVAEPTGKNHYILPMEEDDIRWSYPQTLRKADSEYLKKRVGWKLNSIEEQIENLRQNGRNPLGCISKLEADYRYLEKLIEENDNQ